ncbi:MAG: sulfatase-like hydrolase/transferase [Lentisphaerae bacterium]|jgi:arylsulfatase A-like enzyme|nr:sulfatase-like hydrolase/transferase [Lentisphaerota bacterium]MBT4821879.1 sulfatase-like hydrolase/transferase [Lentisphaerota bacterium]MBT5612437.1 sulfatase-like hydrolase/transferase [Lentisphaerota bacterium]MBT7057143.1 sulfatase-like hydrolase/transferase [Lentisphaerota bacterium]MBT7847271.1 sulfatase-like hydrolase/transferase [Lentisphaerota bacterium]
MRYSILALIATLALISSATGAATSKPNILFILTDDQGYGDLSCNGHPYVKTPHMDRIREEGVRLENFHVAPSCSPTRAGLQTGMHEFKSGVTHTKAGPRQQLSQDRTTIGELLQTHGYATALFRKWHLGGPPPDKRGYDLYLQTHSPPPRNKNMYWDPKIVINSKAQGGPIKGFTPDILTDQAIDYIEDHVKKDSGKPFCCFFWTVTPHAPVMAPDKYKKRFRGKMTESEAAYCAMIENLDDNVGRMMAKLHALGIDEQTLVILMNDNGGTMGVELYNAGMRGAKTSVWPGGTRAFSYWRWPATLEPRTEHALTGYIDVFPTLAEIAGVTIPAEVASELDGYSLFDLLKSPEGAFPRDRLLFEHGARWESGFAAKHKYTQAAVHQGDHMAIRIDTCPCKEGVCIRGRAVKHKTATSMVYTKKKENTYFHWAVTDGWELYNVKEDASCRNDLSGAMPQLHRELTGAYDAWWDDVYPKMMERGGDAPIPGSRRPTGKK